VPIPGTRNADRLVENVGAADVVLTPADLERVHEILPNGSFGGRYPASMMPSW
jgi:aryl-alcohol dehydrogenase-like predicted oxidoreductase